MSAAPSPARRFAAKLARRNILLACARCLTVLVARKHWLVCGRCGARKRVQA